MATFTVFTGIPNSNKIAVQHVDTPERKRTMKNLLCTVTYQTDDWTYNVLIEYPDGTVIKETVAWRETVPFVKRLGKFKLYLGKSHKKGCKTFTFYPAKLDSNYYKHEKTGILLCIERMKTRFLIQPTTKLVLSVEPL